MMPTVRSLASGMSQARNREPLSRSVNRKAALRESRSSLAMTSVETLSDQWISHGLPRPRRARRARHASPRMGLAVGSPRCTDLEGGSTVSDPNISPRLTRNRRAEPEAVKVCRGSCKERGSNGETCDCGDLQCCPGNFYAEPAVPGIAGAGFWLPS